LTEYRRIDPSRDKGIPASEWNKHSEALRKMDGLSHGMDAREWFSKRGELDDTARLWYGITFPNFNFDPPYPAEDTYYDAETEVFYPVELYSTEWLPAEGTSGWPRIYDKDGWKLRMLDPERMQTLYRGQFFACPLFAGKDEYYQPGTHVAIIEQQGRFYILGPVVDMRDMCRFRLLSALYPCGSATAQRIVYDTELACNSYTNITVFDTLAIVPQGGVGAGTQGWARWMIDSKQWEVVALSSKKTPAVTTSTTSTTTMMLHNPCSGRCKWVWSAASGKWTLETDNCEVASTTTQPGSQTSTTQPSQTTQCPCVPTSTTQWSTTTGSGTTKPGSSTTQTTSTTSTTTTSTTTPQCSCVPPQFCGEQDGDCTWTQCSPYPGIQPDCPTSTTTTSTTTSSTTTGGSTSSTTSVDCSTTTTLEPTTTTTIPVPECTYCKWFAFYIANYGGAIGWQLVDNYCLNRAIGCRCPYPDEPASEHLCEYKIVECEVSPPQTTAPPFIPHCAGPCAWAWNCDSLVWIAIAGQWECAHSQGQCARCMCVPPSEPGEACDITLTPCYENCTTQPPPPTTSTTTQTTTTLYDPCTTTTTALPTTTTSTTSTSTTTACFTMGCKWRATSNQKWQIIENKCPPTCPCSEPNWTPMDDCEVAYTSCTGRA